ASGVSRSSGSKTGALSTSLTAHYAAESSATCWCIWVRGGVAARWVGVVPAPGSKGGAGRAWLAGCCAGDVVVIPGGLGADVGVDLGGYAGQWGGDAVAFEHFGDVGAAGEVAGEGGAGGAAGNVECAGHGFGPVGGWHLQDELALSGELGAVSGLLDGDGEGAGAGNGCPVDGAGAVGGAGQSVGGDGDVLQLGGHAGVDV